MDKSPKYQKMCIEAFKDIGYIKPTASSNLMIPTPNSIYNQQTDDFMLSFEDKFEDIGFGSTIARPVGQLYQQDQLQKIIGEDTGFRTQLNLLEEMVYACRDEVGFGFTWERLWLRITMKENYNKEWDDKGEKWTHS